MSAFLKMLKKKALITRSLSYAALPPIKRIGPVQAARLYSSIPAATHDPIGTISAPL